MSKPNYLLNSDGMVVIVMVALILVLMLISSLALVRYSGLDLRISGNQRTYKQDFYTADSGLEIVMAQPSLALANVGSAIHSSYILPDASLPASLKGTKVTTEFEREANPPVNMGYGVTDFRARYYSVTSVNGGQTIEAGAWKVFPKG